MVATRRPESSAFKQQTLKAWRPILTPKLVILLFSAIGIIFIPIGASVISFSNQVKEYIGEDYAGIHGDNPSGCCIANCSATATWQRVDMNPCNVSIVVTESMQPPIYMYYKLTNYYQNHRRYVRSRSDVQLKGNDVVEEDLAESDSCKYHYRHDESVPMNSDPGNIISPCGLIAWSVFNDSFALFDAAGTQITLNESGIAWESDLTHKFKNSPSGSTGRHFPQFAHWRQKPCSELTSLSERSKCSLTESAGAGWCYPGSGYCVEDEHFVVWMRAAGLPSFRKLYARIDTALPAGTYSLRVSNGVLAPDGTYVNAGMGGSKQTFLYPVTSFGGSKAVVLSTATWIGGKNHFLGYAYVVVGVVCIVLALCFLMKYRISPRELADASYISWQQDGGTKQA